MGVENLTNVSDIQIGLSDILPSSLLDSLSNLIFLSKIAVYVIFAYLIFLVVKQFYGWRRSRRINSIYYKVKDIDEKLDLLLDIEKIKLKKEKIGKDKKLKKIKKEEKKIQEKKKGFFGIFKRKKKSKEE